MPSALNIFKDKEKFIDDSLLALESQVTRSQRQLLRLLLDEYISDFTFDAAGNIANTPANLNRAANIDKVFDQFNRTFQNSILAGYVNDNLKLTNFSRDYYIALDKSFKKTVVDKFPRLQANTNASLGIRQVTRNGKKIQEVVKGGYIDRIANSNEVKNKLKNYVINSVSSNTNLKDYQKGFKELLTKTKDFDGELLKYYKQFTYDTFNQVDASSNLFYAEQLGLEYFVYEGSLIKTSRPFCCKRAGKVFSTDDVDSWKCDVDLIAKPKGSGCDDSYKPLIQRGKFNCRHSIRYISKELAESKGITDSKDIVNKHGNCPK